MNYKIAQFILTPPQKTQSTLEIYVSQPDASKEALAGKLFALIEIESNKASALKIINFLINTLNHNYYQNEKMILRERVDTIKVEHIFESALAKTNKKLAEFIQAEKIKLDHEALNITIGVVYNDSLHFANLGKNKALLIYKGKTGEAAKYKLADITEQTGATESKKPATLKLFSNVISGSLPRGGYFIFASETFAEYLSSKQIINIVTTLPPASAAEQIKNTLNKINDYVPFLGIIIKNTIGQETQEVKPSPAASTKASIENLIVTEEKTEKLLTPSGLMNANKWPPVFGNLLGRLKFGRHNLEQPLYLKDKIFTKKKSPWLSLSKALKTIKNLLIYLINLLIFIFKIITNKQALADFGRGLTLKIKNFFTGVKAGSLKLLFWYRRLNKINKILFSSLLVCILIFSLNLSWQSLKKGSEEKQTVIANLVSLIEQKQNQIDASLLYDNEAGAGKLIADVKNLLGQLPQTSPSQKDLYQKLSAKYQTQIEKVNQVIRVNPVELANFINLSPRATPKNIILAKGKIYAADPGQAVVYSIDLGNKLITSINLGDQKINRLDFPSLDKNNNLYYLSTTGLATLDIKSEKFSSLNVSYSGNLDKAVGLAQYNNKFYLANATAGQIYRFTKNGDKLTDPTPWFNSREDLGGVVGLDIDGNIYLLKTSGEVLKYTKGKKQSFSQAKVEPALSQATEIKVSAESNYIYIFEPLAKRLVVLDKDGKFNCQYTSDKFDRLKDFLVDEKGKKIYFLNNATVYSIEASHLEK